MASIQAVATCLLALVLASTFLTTVQSLRPAPEDGVTGKTDFSLTQTEKSAFKLFSILNMHEGSTGKDFNSAGRDHPAHDLLPVIRNILGVFIMLVALATCVIKRSKKDNSTGGGTVAHQQSIWEETSEQHWERMQACANYVVVPHRPSYMSAPAAGQITRVWARAQPGTAVLGNQPLFLLAVDGAVPLALSTPAPGCVREVAVTAGMRVAKDAWLAALDTRHSSHHGAQPVDDPANHDAHPPHSANPVLHPEASSSLRAQPGVHPDAHPPQRAHRVVHPRAWNQCPQPAQDAQHAQPTSPRYTVGLERAYSI